MNLSPTQKKILTIGGPIVAALAIFAYLRSRSTSASSAGASTGGTTSTADQPIGLSQLADFENAITTELGNLQQQISASTPAPASPAPTSGTTSASPAPNPTPATTSPVPVAVPWGLIPNPTAGSELVGAGVAYETVGKHQYYDTAQVQEISTGAELQQLSKEGFYTIAIGGHEYFNPNQTTAGRAGK